MDNGMPSSRTDTIKFSGQSGEYFKLWFVNLFLSIITLGIYSAWAKVRDTQYMYGHTHVDGHSFRYLATPMQILRGRIIAVIVFVLYGVLSSINPAIGTVLALCFLLAMPWLLIQGVRFSMRMTAYRNVRFSFEGTYGGVALHFILLPILGAITFYLAMPWVMQKIQQYIHNHITFAGKPFQQKSSVGQYYIAALCSVVVALLAGAVIFGLGGSAIATASEGFSFALLIVGLAGVALFSIAGAVYRAIIYNHLMNTLTIDDVVSFDAQIKIAPFVTLVLSNMFLLVITLGLAVPITKIRMARYLAKVTQVTVMPGVDSLVNTVEGKNSAFGEEAAGLFDTDLSII